MGENRLKQFREEKTWSVKQLAREANLSESVIKRMEEGEQTTRISKLKIAKALRKDIKEVFPHETD